MSSASSLSGAQPRGSVRALAPFVRYVARYWRRAVAAVLALVVSAAATLAVPFALRRMVDHGFSNAVAGAGAVDDAFLGILAAVVVIALAAATRFYLVTTLGERLASDLRVDLFAHLATLDASFHDTARSGELVSRLTADTTQIKASFGASASVVLRNLIMFLGSVGLMIATSPRLSIGILAAIPFVVAPLVLSARVVRRRSRLAQDALADASAFAVERLSAVRTMQAFCAEESASARFSSAVRRAFVASCSTIRAQAMLTGTGILLALGSVVGLLWFGAWDVVGGRTTPGALSQFVMFAVLGATSLGQLSEVWNEVSAAAGAAGRIGELLEVAPRICAPRNPVPLPEPPRGEIRFDRVSFAYPSAPQSPALRNVSFRVAPGERVALVGPSGAGKSTVFQLLMRFYDPDAGAILLDGIDIRAAAPKDLRARIALVPQEPAIFAGTVADNIAYGRPDAPEADIRRAARRAAADGFIGEIEGAYGATIGERGATLSGGQKQRLAFARALIKDAALLLLDEATSALDAENEALMQAALDSESRSRTILIIAHRLATVRGVDRILVFESGRIVEEGTHASLIASEGIYARLARLQFETCVAAPA